MSYLRFNFSFSEYFVLRSTNLYSCPLKLNHCYFYKIYSSLLYYANNFQFPSYSSNCFLVFLKFEKSGAFIEKC